MIRDSEFAQRLVFLTTRPTDRDLRRLIFNYCKRYQAVYGFDLLENALAYFEIVFEEDANKLEDWAEDLSAVKDEIALAMGEYFISLNEVATALNRLLDQRELTLDDALGAIGHVWAAHACNEAPEDFMSREDAALCELLASINAK